jgi:hypothetical protein
MTGDLSKKVYEKIFLEARFLRILGAQKLLAGTADW